jgi:hypothetical protein
VRLIGQMGQLRSEMSGSSAVATVDAKGQPLTAEQRVAIEAASRQPGGANEPSTLSVMYHDLPRRIRRVIAKYIRRRPLAPAEIAEDTAVTQQTLLGDQQRALRLHQEMTMRCMAMNMPPPPPLPAGATAPRAIHPMYWLVGIGLSWIVAAWIWRKIAGGLGAIDPLAASPGPYGMNGMGMGMGGMYGNGMYGSGMYGNSMYGSGGMYGGMSGMSGMGMYGNSMYGNGMYSRY